MGWHSQLTCTVNWVKDVFPFGITCCALTLHPNICRERNQVCQKISKHHRLLRMRCLKYPNYLVIVYIYIFIFQLRYDSVVREYENLRTKHTESLASFTQDINTAQGRFSTSGTKLSARLSPSWVVCKAFCFPLGQLGYRLLILAECTIIRQ